MFSEKVWNHIENLQYFHLIRTFEDSEAKVLEVKLWLDSVSLRGQPIELSLQKRDYKKINTSSFDRWKSNLSQTQ